MPNLPHLPKTYGSLSRLQRIYADAFLSGSGQDDADQKRADDFPGKARARMGENSKGAFAGKTSERKRKSEMLAASEVPEIRETLEDAAREEGELLEALCRVRKTVEAFLTDRAELPEQRISMVLALCHDVQNQIGK